MCVYILVVFFKILLDCVVSVHASDWSVMSLIIVCGLFCKIYKTLRTAFYGTQNHLARHSKRGKKKRQTEEEVGRQYQGIDRPRVRRVPEGSGEQGKMEETGREIFCGSPVTLAVKG